MLALNPSIWLSFAVSPKSVLPITDEAQASCEYLSLWNDLIKGISTHSGHYIVPFHLVDPVNMNSFTLPGL